MIIWREEEDSYTGKSIISIRGLHIKKLKRGFKMKIEEATLLLDWICMNNIKGQTQLERSFIERAYTHGIFMLRKHISDKIGKQIRNRNISFHGKTKNRNNRAQILNGEVIDQKTEVDLWKKVAMIKQLNIAIGELLDIKVLLDGEEGGWKMTTWKIWDTWCKWWKAR
ncbi:MAG: hypothetical protein Ta2E_11990 [Mycoplasmoidaceae bacterium]|nr:MAG: hypothetical protein Ta2E_11990 [Mycoplasmoidaceae bacterium]